MSKRLALLLVPSLSLSLGCYMAAPELNGSDQTAREIVSAICEMPEDEARLADQVLQLVNLDRTSRGMAPVVRSGALDAIAGDYACSMISRGFFGHFDPDTDSGPGDRAMEHRYVFFSIGENLAAGQQTAAEVMREWMDSPSHRDVILDPRWDEVGIAVRFGGAYGTYWVQEFADPANLGTRLSDAGPN